MSGPSIGVSGRIRDARRGTDEAGAVEFTLVDGRVLHVACLGLHEQEQQRTREALLAALGASGLTVVEHQP